MMVSLQKKTLYSPADFSTSPPASMMRLSVHKRISHQVTETCIFAKSVWNHFPDKCILRHPKYNGPYLASSDNVINVVKHPNHISGVIHLFGWLYVLLCKV